MKIHDINLSYSNYFLRFGLFSKKVNIGICAKLDTSQYISVGFFFYEIWGLCLGCRKGPYLKARIILPLRLIFGGFFKVHAFMLFNEALTK